MQENSGNRMVWIVAGGIGLLLFFGLCMIVLVAGSFFISGNSGTSTASQPVIVEQPAQRAAPQVPAERPTPVPVALSALSGEVDYETAQLVNIYQQWNGSVVNVLVLGSVSDQLPSEVLPENTDPDSLFPQGQGSGFVWDLEGHIVTNAHVVEGASQVQVTFGDGTVAIAEVVGEDLDSDLAVVKINPAGYNLVPVVSGNLDEMQVGMRVAAIGNPFGLNGTLTSG
ncbi:MAG: trypsin-like peptidase domain-containing protein, partial [Caldilineaceae bacterium]